MVRSLKQRINKEIVAFNSTLGQMDLIDIYRTFHPKEANYTFFSNAHGTFSKIGHMVGNKISLEKFKTVGLISSIFLDHNGLTLETNVTKKSQKHSNTQRLNNMLLNNEWVNYEIKE